MVNGFACLCDTEENNVIPTNGMRLVLEGAQLKQHTAHLTECQRLGQVIIHIHAQLGNDLCVCLRLKCHLLLDLQYAKQELT